MWLWRREWNLTRGSSALLSQRCQTRRVKLLLRSGFPSVSVKTNMTRRRAVSDLHKRLKA